MTKANPANEPPSSLRSSKPAAVVASTRKPYLREVLTRLPTLTNRQIKDVTPSAWAKAQKNAHQRQAA